jgi:hypothetical protein
MIPGQSPLPDDDPVKTTVTVKNIPHNFTREMLTSLLDGAGFWARYNFLYLPADFRSMRSFGYAIINFVSHGDALCLGHVFHGYNGLLDGTNSYKCLEIEWSASLQGLEMHVERYRDSPIMHKRVQDELKPMLFVRGHRVAFPRPTKALKMPRYSNRKPEGNEKAFLASPGNLFARAAVGLTMTYSPLAQWKPDLLDAASRPLPR